MVDTTYSDLVLMIGGQVLFLFIMIVITVFGVDPIISPKTNKSPASFFTPATPASPATPATSASTSQDSIFTSVLSSIYSILTLAPKILLSVFR